MFYVQSSIELLYTINHYYQPNTTFLKGLYNSYMMTTTIIIVITN